MATLQQLLFATLVLILSLTFAGAEFKNRNEAPVGVRGRDGRAFSIFQVVSFPNDACQGTGNVNGTCYTASECASRSGNNGGTCAAGFGVCCTFIRGCGATSSENCTHFSETNLGAGACTLTICPCTTNICQLRLDFQAFQITGPDSTSNNDFTTNNGLPSATNNARRSSLNTACLTDTFSVTNPGGNSPPQICGTNTGEHMYVDSATACNDLNFNFGSAGTAGNRNFNIKVTQISCNSEILAPDGCTQYFFGANTDSVESYNFNSGNGHQLANQDQAICVRRERGNCRICWTAVIQTDFDISDGTQGQPRNSEECCAYGTKGTGRNGYDCVIVPQASNTAGVVTPSRLCGRGQGLRTGKNNNNKSVCSTQQPFRLRFMSDGFEFEGGKQEAENNDMGFRLQYIQDSINC